MMILEDISILDFTHVWFGPYCTMILGKLGAEVIKVEPPWGEVGRYGPGELVKGASTNFYALNINKMGISINLKTSEGLEIIKDLVKMSDVIVQNFAPGTMERLGLSYNVLKSLKPDIIYAALSGFGQEGPYSKYGSFAPIAEAISGHTYETGKSHDIDGPPVNIAGALGDLGPAVYAALAIVGAIRHRDRTGEGQMIDVNQVDCMVALNCCSNVAYDLLKESPIQRRKNRSKDPNRIWGIVKVKDGWIQVAGERPKAIENLKEKFNVEELNLELLKEKISGMTRKEAFKFLAEEELPCAPIYESHEGMFDPHLLHRDMWINVLHKNAGNYIVPNFPIRFSRTPGTVKTSSPLLGQNTEDVLTSKLGMAKETVKDLERKGIIVLVKE